jgi:hypothetical protein
MPILLPQEPIIPGISPILPGKSTLHYKIAGLQNHSSGRKGLVPGIIIKKCGEVSPGNP